MKIRLRAMMHPDTAGELITSGSEDIVGPIDMGMFFDSSWPDETLAAFLRKFAYVEGVDFNVWMEFTNHEVESSRWLMMRPSKVVRESEADFERSRAHIDTLPFLGDNPSTRYRLPDRLYLSRHRLKPSQIAGYGEWTSEFIAHIAAYEELTGCGLTGLEQRLVIDTEAGLNVPEHVMLYAAHTLGNRILDLTAPRIVTEYPDERGYERLGCLCYPPEVLEDAPDFSRTAENLVGFEFTEWVVSRMVRECCRDSGLKGVRFEPVMVDLTPGYDEYLRLWGSLYDAMSAGRYTIRGRRPWDME